MFKSSQITIKDIARELNISPSTVSRALKDHPDISTETKKAVNDLARKLNYQPNSIALSLRKSRTNTIGVIIPEIVHFFFSTVIAGIEDVAYANGYNVVICQSNESYERELTDTRALMASRVDGLLVSLSRETKDYSHFQEIYDKGTPLVFFDRVCEDINTSKVIIDDTDSAFQAVEHLIAQGCKRIAHLAGPSHLNISKGRLEGYRAALQKHGLPVEDSLVISCGVGDEKIGAECTRALLSLDAPPDAIFANNDISAIGAMQEIKKRGMRIPDDIAIVGFSDWMISSFVEPSLTSISQPGFEMGQAAAHLFLEQIELKDDEPYEPKISTLKTNLIIRDSSKRIKAKV